MGKGRKPTKRSAPTTRGHNAFIAIVVLVVVVWIITIASFIVLINNYVFNNGVDVSAVVDLCKKFFTEW